jgi:hypothetical protein
MIDRITPALVANLQADLKGKIPDAVRLPRGTRRYQTELSDLCTAHTALASAESAGLPHDFDPEDVLAMARKNLTSKQRLSGGAYLVHAYLAVQKLIGHKAKLVHFRMIDGSGLETIMHPSQGNEIGWYPIKLWLAAKKTQVGISLQYFKSDHAASDGVLLGGKGKAGSHAGPLYGYGPRTYHRYRIPFLPIGFGERREECAWFHNTLFPGDNQAIPTRRINSTTHVGEALAFYPA